MEKGKICYISQFVTPVYLGTQQIALNMENRIAVRYIGIIVRYVRFYVFFFCRYIYINENIYNIDKSGLVERLCGAVIVVLGLLNRIAYWLRTNRL